MDWVINKWEHDFKNLFGRNSVKQSSVFIGIIFRWFEDHQNGVNVDFENVVEVSILPKNTFSLFLVVFSLENTTKVSSSKSHRVFTYFIFVYFPLC